MHARPRRTSSHWLTRSRSRPRASIQRCGTSSPTSRPPEPALLTWGKQQAPLAKFWTIRDPRRERPCLGDAVRLLVRTFRVVLDAYYRFNANYGWAIASHIALSTLMSLFPFLILVTAIAGFIGSKELADEVARILIEAWPAE